MTRKNFRRTRLAISILATLSAPAGALTTINVEDTGATDVLFTGPTAYQSGNLGDTMAKGDFNGDGLDDLALGAPGMSSPQGIVRAGNIYLFYGGGEMNTLPAEVTTQDGLEDAMLFGAETKERAGDLLAVGDFNADGKDDLVIVGQYGVDHDGTTGVTKIWVVYGQAGLSGTKALASTADVLIERATGPSSSWPTFQVSAIASGDINGDGYDDLLFSDKISNEFHVILGQAAHWSTTLDIATDTDIVIDHSLDTNLFSTNYFPLYNQGEIAGVAAGDLNGDGTDDLILGVPNETAGSLTNAGRVYVLLGGSGMTSGSSFSVNLDADSVITGGCLKDKAGGPLTVANLNGDKYGDLIIGEPLSQRCITNSTGLGRVHALMGKGAWPGSISLFSDADVTLNISGNGNAETSVARIGFKTGQVVVAEDMNLDGYDDLLISSPGAFHGNGDNGWVHLVYGGANMAAQYELDLDADYWFETPEPVGPRLISGRMGESVAAGDFNGDGLPDLAMGAPEGLSAISGFVPLIFDPAIPAAKPSCSGANPVVSEGFSNGTSLCEGSNSLTATSTVSNTATVFLRAPIITLDVNFWAKDGSQVNAHPTD